MKILFYQWNAYNLKDIYTTFCQLHHEVTMLTDPIKNPEEDAAYIEKLRKILLEKRYDFLFSINFFPVLAEACHQTETLYVSWNCDSPLLAMCHDSVFYSTNVVCIFDYSNYEEFRHLGVTNIYHLPLAVNTDRLSKQIEISSPIKYPVSFVGSLYEENSYDRIASSLPPYLSGYLEGAMNAQLLVSGGNILETLLTDEICMKLEEIIQYKKSEHSWASTRALFASTVLGFKTASLKRQKTLNYLSLQLLQTNAKREQVHLFTNSKTADLPFISVHGPVDYQTEMPQVFFDSAINLNMTIPNIKTGIPLRVWDVLGSNGFLLTNYQTEFDSNFKIGKHIEIYEDQEELIDKVAFYLSHDTLRKKIAKQGFELADKEHNYRIRINALFEIIKQYI